MSEKVEIIIICPHCKDFVLIEQLNCCIFRHGSMKNDNKQLHPHLCKKECDFLFNNNLIWGCGKPFKIIKKDDGNIEVEICDYI